MIMWICRRCGWGPALALAWALCGGPAVASTPQAPAKEGAVAAPIGSQDIKVAEDEDDAEEASAGDVTLSSSDLELIYDEDRDPHGNQTVGIRFAGVKVPRGAQVRNAFIQFTCKDASEEPCRLTIHGQAAANAQAFREEPKSISARPRTKAEVRWSPPPWKEGAAGAAERTGDLAPIVQEIVGAPGWSPGNSLVFIITGPAHDMRRAWSHDGNSKGAPLLHVEWGAGGSVQPAAESPAQKQAVGSVASPATTPPAATAPPPRPPEPAAPTEPAGTPGRTLSETFNTLTDDLMAAGGRLLDLPLFLLLAAIGILATAAALLARALCRRGERWGLYHTFLAVLGVVVVLAAACIMDRRLVLLQDNLRQLSARMNSQATTLHEDVAQLSSQMNSLGEAARKQHAPRKALLLDAAAAQEALRKQFGKLTMQVSVYDDATDLVQMRLVETVAQVFLAVVDLQHPGLEIRVNPAIKQKWLTSEFARENGCTLAINGEAGISSGLNCGLGEWRGYLVCRGQVVSEEKPGTPRPCLAFDRQNRATYLPMAAGDRKLPPGTYNAIWGHFDALLAGVEPKGEEELNPYTAMGINEEGTRLYLLVVDGRQPKYSMGLCRRDIARVLKGFGAYHGMLCDGGGSTCIYLEKLGGITNIPSSGGKERPTYTHFGLALPTARQAEPKEAGAGGQ